MQDAGPLGFEFWVPLSESQFPHQYEMGLMIQADLRDLGGLFPDHLNKANIAIKKVT